MRIETYRQHIFALPPDSSGFDIVRGTLTDLLPSLNAAYSITPKTNVRWAYSTTVVRPRDRELVPFDYLDYITTFKTRGNANLIRTKIHNFDLRYEYYPRKADLVSATLFYKYFFHPVEQALNEGQLVNVFDPVSVYDVRNQSRGAVAGLEIEFRQSLESYVDNRYLAGLGVYGNLSLMASRINPGDALSVFGPGRSLQGQANFLFNLGLTYGEERTGLSAAVFYNRAGRRIALVGVSDDVSPSIFEMPRDVIDLQISKTFFDRLTVRFAVQDLLGQRFKLIQFYDGGDTFNENRDNLVRNERRAPAFYLTATYKIK
jgi:outer membrane receptor protein involved in Fe transport